MAPTRAASAGQGTQGKDELKVCRGDVASHDEVASPEAQQEARDARNALRKRLIDARSRGASPETRALGAWLAEKDAEGRASLPYFDQTQLCKLNFGCSQAVAAEERVAVEKEVRPQVDELVGQAVDSSNPAIYATAFDACHILNVDPSPSCQRISTQRWAQIDSDNATPWLRLLDEAAARDDTASANEAFYRASIASSVRSGGESLLLYAEPALSFYGWWPN